MSKLKGVTSKQKTGVTGKEQNEVERGLLMNRLVERRKVKDNGGILK